MRLLLVLLTACGRLGFDGVGDAAMDSAPPDSGFVGARQTELRAAVGESGDLFGQAAAVSTAGATIVVGAESEDSIAMGINGDPSNNQASASGAAYVFTRSGTTWIQEAFLKQSNTNPGDRFGFAVAISGDGTTIAIGAPAESGSATGIDGDQFDDTTPEAGSVYVFVRSGAVWTQQAYVKASNRDPFDNFGVALALSEDGATLVVGASGEDGGGTGVNAPQGDNSVGDAGAVYVFSRSGVAWSQQAYLKASNASGLDRFGDQLALSATGSTLAVGAVNEASAATGIDGDQGSDNAMGAGAVYVFTRAGTTWSQQAYVKASNTSVEDRFGVAIALSADGDTLLATAYAEDSAAIGVDGDQTDETAADSGAAYVFTRAGTTWSQQAYLKASNTGANDVLGFNAALSADGSTIAIGAEQEDSGGMGIGANPANEDVQDSGAVYIYARSGGTWLPRSFVKATNTAASDYFGDSVGLSGNGGTLVVGARFEDGPIVGDFDVGAIYIYE